jgi:hypothetical protein
LASISSELLEYCLAGRPWPDSLLREILTRATSADAEIARIASRELFTVVIERLGDLFEPELCDTYARLFSQAIAFVRPGTSASELIARYERIRKPRHVAEDPSTVFVLSRITLGADVAVTSVFLDGAKKRWPRARIRFVGPRKNWELFAADPRIEHVEFAYGRSGTLVERLAVVPSFDEPGSIVLDPDSRITQLGLLPVCPDDRYYFFESRAYGGDSDDPLPLLASRWVAETLGVNTARAYVSPQSSAGIADVTVSFGVGENEDKRIDDSFEERLLSHLARSRGSILIDKGAGESERKRVEAAIARSDAAGIRAWEGAYAPFAGSISQSKLYVGYDSAGQHVAAACGIPLVSVFTGYVSDRMFNRWRPYGAGPMHVIKAKGLDPEEVLSRTIRAIDELLQR